MSTDGKEEPRARTNMRWYYWEEKSARFRRLQRLVEIYIRMLEWAVHQASDRQVEQDPKWFGFGLEDLAALRLFTIADVYWRDSENVMSVHCRDEETGRRGFLYGDSLTPKGGSESLAPFREDNSVTSVYFRPKIKCLPSLIVLVDLKQAYTAAEEDLLAVQIQWGGPPLFEDCQDGENLIQYMRRAKLTPEELLRDLGVWKTRRIENIESARRGAYRAAKRSSIDRDEDSGVLRTSEEPKWLPAAEVVRKANKAVRVRWDWKRWERLLKRYKVETKPAIKKNGTQAVGRRVVSVRDAMKALKDADRTGEFDKMKTEKDRQHEEMCQRIEKEFGSTALIDEMFADD